MVSLPGESLKKSYFIFSNNLIFENFKDNSKSIIARSFKLAQLIEDVMKCFQKVILLKFLRLGKSKNVWGTVFHLCIPSSLLATDRLKAMVLV